jgi:hypothetical protein
MPQACHGRGERRSATFPRVLFEREELDAAGGPRHRA